MKLILTLAAMAALLAACAPKAGPPANPETLAPADTRLAELYAGSCKACHVNAQSGAPVVQDRAAWDPRWKQGEEVLMDHVIQGYRAMPALGQCAACTPEDFKALTRFMAGRE